MRKSIVAATAAAVALTATPAGADHEGTTVHGYITGVVWSAEHAAALPCPPYEAFQSSWTAVGVVCVPKQSAQWSLDQPAGCYYKYDLGVPSSDCVRAVDEGDVVRVWAYRGAVDEYFELTWH